MAIDCRALVFRMLGSTSAPARKVSKTLAKPARKSIQGVVAMPRTLPAKTPTAISRIAAETASSTLSRAATRIRRAARVAVARVSIHNLPSTRGGLDAAYHDQDVVEAISRCRPAVWASLIAH